MAVDNVIIDERDFLTSTLKVDYRSLHRGKRSVCRSNPWLVSNSETVNVKFHWLYAHVTMTFSDLWPIDVYLFLW